jgi:glycosyltransferase involved in cell wall biosynthesis
MHLSIVIPTLHRLETAQLLSARVRGLFPDLDVEAIIITPGAQESRAEDARVRYLRDAGRGVYAAYSQGLRAASGEYVWFLGDDDYPLEGAADLRAPLLAGAADVLVAPVIFSSGRLYRPRRFLLPLQFFNWCQQGVIYRRSVLGRYRFYRRLNVEADHYVNIRILADRSVKTVFIDTPVCLFGDRGVSSRETDSGYRFVQFALARRTLGRGAFLLFQTLICLGRWSRARPAGAGS